jgi:hypothetical protein
MSIATNCADENFRTASGNGGGDKGGISKKRECFRLTINKYILEGERKL